MGGEKGMAVIVLKCGHKLESGKTMRMLQVAKGEQRECPESCGMQGIKQVERRPFKQGESW